jgi:hypothetical protein
MYCSQCGKPAQGKFCCYCGAPLVVPSFGGDAVAVATAPEPVGNWENECRYEALVQIPHIRATIERHAGMAKKKITGEEFLKMSEKLSEKFVSSTHPSVYMAVTLVQPLTGKLGIKTGKERMEMIEAPIGRVMFRLLCSMARNGQPLRHVKQAEDGCEFDAVLPSDMWALEGELVTTVRRQGPRTEVASAASIKGQLIDWGKSRRCLDALFADLRLDPG